MNAIGAGNNVTNIFGTICAFYSYRVQRFFDFNDFGVKDDFLLALLI
jgi:hypothetical protein